LSEDDINKQLKRLDQLSDEMKKMSELTNKLNDVDSHKQQLLDLQVICITSNS